MNNFINELSEEYLYEHTLKELFTNYSNFIIIANAKIVIFPIFNKSLTRTFLEQSRLKYETISSVGEAIFNFTLHLPNQFKNFKYFKVNLTFRNTNYSFKCVPGIPRIIIHNEANPSNILIKLNFNIVFN